MSKLHLGVGGVGSLVAWFMVVGRGSQYGLWSLVGGQSFEQLTIPNYQTSINAKQPSFLLVIRPGRTTFYSLLPIEECSGRACSAKINN